MKKFIALLLVMVMLLSLTACSKDKGEENKKTSAAPQTIAEEYVKAGTNGEFAKVEQYLLHDPESVMIQLCEKNGQDPDEIYEHLSEEAGQSIRSWKEAQNVAKEMMLEEITAEYGEGYKVEVAAVESESLTPEALETIYGDKLTRVAQWAKINTKDISEARIYQVEIIVTGSIESDAQVVEVVLVNYKGNWKALTPELSLLGLLFGY